MQFSSTNIENSLCTSAIDQIVFPQNSYIEALTLNVTGFGNKAYEEIIKVKCWT